MIGAPWMDDSLAANGRSVQENFTAWFGDSKVFDSQSQPMTVYHGSRSDFSQFKGKDGFNFFAETTKGAAIYGSGSSGCIYPVFLRIERPFDLRDIDFGDEFTKSQAAKLLKIDKDLLAKLQFSGKGHLWEFINHEVRKSILLRHDGIVSNEDNNEIFVPMYPNQIKAAIGNCGLYLKNSDCLTDHHAHESLTKAIKAKSAIEKVALKVKATRP